LVADSKVSKSKKFKELANSRVPKAISKIRLVGNLANTNNYEYTESEARQIIDALAEELNILRKRFTSRKKNNAFRL